MVPIFSESAETVQNSCAVQGAPRARSDSIESGTRSRFVIWSHFLRKTGVHFSGKCSGQAKYWGRPASGRRDDRAAALAEADAGEARTAAVGAHDHRVAVLQEAAAFAGGELDRPAAAGGDFEQAAEPVVLRRGDRAGPEDVARPQ